MMRFLVALTLVCGLVVGLSAPASAADVDLTGVKCVVKDKPAKADKSVEFEGKTVYFCCPGCVAKFKADPSAYADEAHLQMLKTGQIEQVACPVAGRPLNEAQTVSFEGVDVSFCCPGCKGKFASAGDEDKLDMLFGKYDTTFADTE